LHKLQPSKGAVRRREGGTISLGLKRGTLVKHIKYGFCYIGGNVSYQRMNSLACDGGIDAKVD
jgi:hypothetical protein